MQKIVVLNPKGGSGKSTIVTNLAAYYAAEGQQTAIMDLDAQGSSYRWLKKRFADQPAIHGISAFEQPSRVTRSFQLRVPMDTEQLIVDTPAALDPQRLHEITRGADAILVPVLPSDIDIHAASRCIADLLLVAKIRRDEGRLGIIANRVRKNTVVFQSLMRFLTTLRIPIVATLRDTQNYVHAAEQGVGIHEMKPYLVRDDVAHWEPLMQWLRSRPHRLLRPLRTA